MKNKQFGQLYKLLKAGKSHSGFTLIELLSGLIMSGIVVGGLGYGLLQLTKTTRDETNKINARNEASRAIEFISDELRRAQSIEVDNSTANINVVAPNYNVPTDIDGAVPLQVRLALRIPGVDERIIYSVAKPDEDDSDWQGPLAIYRWGPRLGDNGQYNDANDAGAWINNVLIDGLDDETQTVVCGGVNQDYEGFFACIVDDDNDGAIEDGLTDTNGDGQVNFIDGDGIENDSADDVDGISITAQLFFTSNIDITNTDYDKQYTEDTQVVARARVRDTDAEEEDPTTPISFRTLGAEYSLGTIGGANCNGEETWTMRNDFFNDATGDNPTYTPTTWIHDPDRQSQQINIDTTNPLTISSIPFIPSSGTCSGTILSRGNESGVDGTPNLHEKLDPYTSWTPKLNGAEAYETSDFTIDFDNPATFNGGDKDDHNPVPIGADGQEVDHVRIFKKGGVIEYKKGGVEIPLDGYDDYIDATDSSTDDGEYSLGEFLAYKGYAKLDGTKYRLVNDDDVLSTNPFLSKDPNAHPHLIKLEDKERIVAVEIGQAEVGAQFPPDYTIKNPGFDLQDNIVLMSVDKFAGDESTH